MPGRREHDSAVGHGFGLELDGVRVSMLTEVSGLTTEREVIEVKQTAPDGTSVVKKLPGRPTGGEVTVTRRVTDDRTFERWVRDVALGAGASPRVVNLVVFDVDGQRVVTYGLVRAWPRKLEITGLKAGGTESPTERLVLVHEGVERA